VGGKRSSTSTERKFVAEKGVSQRKRTNKKKLGGRPAYRALKKNPHISSRGRRRKGDGWTNRRDAEKIPSSFSKKACLGTRGAKIERGLERDLPARPDRKETN